MEKLSQIFNIPHIHLEFSLEEYEAMTTPIFQGFMKGKKHTDETKVLMSQAKIGIKKSNVTKAKMSNAQLGNTKMLGKKHSEKTKKKMSLSATGRKNSQEHIDKIVKAKTGTKYKTIRSQESRNKMSEATKLIPKVNCPHCTMTGKPNTMSRWHFNNCKDKA